MQIDKIRLFIKAHKKAVIAGSAAVTVLVVAVTSFAAYKLINNGASSNVPNLQAAIPVSYPITGIDPISYPVSSTTPTRNKAPISYPVSNNGQPEVKLFFTSMNGEISAAFTQTTMPHSNAQWVLDATGANLINEGCHLITTYTAPGQPANVSTGPLNLMPEGHASLNEMMYVGDYEFKAECAVQGKTYTAIATAHIAAYTPSICDTPAPSSSSTATSLTDLKTKFVGHWRGCMRWFKLDPDMAYQVEFTFKDDGTYTGLNYEKVLTPSVPGWYDHSATYWGDDNQSLPYLIQSIDDAGTGYGTITLFPNNADVNLNNVQVNNDNLHFEIMYDSYGPLVYDLTRLNN